MIEQTGNNYIDLLNCISWIALTVAFIIIMFKCANSWIEVKHAIRDKIRNQTNKILLEDYLKRL